MFFLDPRIHISIRALLFVHALAGTVALAVFLVPLISAKGGRTHSRFGWIYFYAMVVVAYAAAIITVWRMAIDPNRNERTMNFSAFIFFCAMMAMSSLIHGLRVLKYKERTTPSYDWRNIGFPLVVVATGLLTFFIRTYYPNNNLIVFGIVGLTVGCAQLIYWLSIPRARMHWWYQHMAAMITACACTLTAFMVSPPRYFMWIPIDNVLYWILPTAIFTPILFVWILYYRRKFNRPELKQSDSGPCENQRSAVF